MLTRAVTALLDLLLPAPCGGCGAAVGPGIALCATCTAVLARPVPVPDVPGLPPAMALAPYAGAARALVIAYKERGRRDLATPLAAALAHALDGLGLGGPCLLVPAPSRRSAARARGGDHMLRLVHRLAATGHGRVLPALELTAGARDSVGLSPAARAANLAAHLRVRAGPLRGVARGLPVVLLDDVVTTGATAVVAARALAAAGLPVDLLLVVTAVGAQRPVVPGGRVPRTGVRPPGAIRRPGPSPDPGTPARHLPATRRTR